MISFSQCNEAQVLAMYVGKREKAAAKCLLAKLAKDLKESHLLHG